MILVPVALFSSLNQLLSHASECPGPTLGPAHLIFDPDKSATRSSGGLIAYITP